MTPVKVFFDTEFVEDGKTIELISLGAITEFGETFYAESNEVQWWKANQWVWENVHPHLLGYEHLMPKVAIASKFFDFVRKCTKGNPEFWAYYADYDWVVLCQLYGAMIDLPKGWPMYCRDIKQYCDLVGNPQLPKQPGVAHHALNDAIHNRRMFNWLNDNYEIVTRKLDF